MTDEQQMPRYDGMEYEELVAASQFLWMENAKLRELVAIFRSKEDRHPCINAQCLKCNDAELCEREAELVRELRIEVKS